MNRENAWVITPEDAYALYCVKQLVNKKPSYGYRRITSRLMTEYGLKINHKRVYRLMKENQLLLAKYGKRPTRTHDGKVITLHSNTRWCSDSFIIQCDNGDKLQVVFAMDTCDREVMSYAVSTRGIDGAMVRDLMARCVEYRFGQTHLPRTIQWLSDNGSCYTARKTVHFGRELGFEVCTTPPYSPESNGMAEAFVKTFKRDYAWPSDLSDANTVIQSLPGWFEDYNEFAPHKGLKMRSPRQFIAEREAS